MNKTFALIGLASMLAVTPAMATTPAKHTTPVRHAAMCMSHGKKVACKTHTAHKVVKKHHVMAAVKKPASTPAPYSN